MPCPPDRFNEVSIKEFFMSVNQIQIHVENIKCGGCEKSILKGLAGLEGLSDVVIGRDQQLISATGDPPNVSAPTTSNSGYSSARNNSLSPMRSHAMLPIVVMALQAAIHAAGAGWVPATPDGDR